MIFLAMCLNENMFYSWVHHLLNYNNKTTATKVFATFFL